MEAEGQTITGVGTAPQPQQAVPTRAMYLDASNHLTDARGLVSPGKQVQCSLRVSSNAAHSHR